ncbi:hypothetical protein FACS1894199_04460 [Bacteroidia bacterium]|nr:hypothetical protein FACS1894199_04460 [Bacteroidia bacterium]
MTIRELNKRKTELACKILDENNELIINQLLIYFNQTEKPVESLDKIFGFPYTDEEKLADVELAMKDFYSGHTITHDDYIKKHASWW